MYLCMHICMFICNNVCVFLNLNSNTQVSDRPQHDRPALCVSAQHSVSPSSVSLCVQPHKKKLGALQKVIRSAFSSVWFFFKLRMSETAYVWNCVTWSCVSRGSVCTHCCKTFVHTVARVLYTLLQECLYTLLQECLYTLLQEFCTHCCKSVCTHLQQFCTHCCKSVCTHCCKSFVHTFVRVLNMTDRQQIYCARCRRRA
jgi:hypothetical protein